MIIWLQFLACTAIILFAGTNLSKYGDIIAEKTGLGRTWIGVLLIAATTSLPELITGISSVAIFDVPNIAVGNVLGACMVNILVIALLDAIGGPSPVSTKVHQGQALTAAFGILLLGLASISIAAGANMPAIGWIGVYSVIFIVIYIVAMRMVFLYEKRRIAEFVKEMAEELSYQDISRVKAFTRFGFNAVLIMGAGTYLPHVGEQIATMTGLGQTFVGTIFIALSTTLPELVVSITALRIGAIDMAVGNLLGSTLFNVVILSLDDLFYTKGPLLSYISGNHLVTANAAISMTAVAIIGLTYRVSKKLLFFAWDSLAILVVYLFASVVLYLTR
jgi:cation:H+ antiporter